MKAGLALALLLTVEEPKVEVGDVHRLADSICGGEKIEGLSIRRAIDKVNAKVGIDEPGCSRRGASRR